MWAENNNIPKILASFHTEKKDIISKFSLKADLRDTKISRG